MTFSYRPETVEKPGLFDEPIALNSDTSSISTQLRVEILGEIASHASLLFESGLSDLKEAQEHEKICEDKEHCGYAQHCLDRGKSMIYAAEIFQQVGEMLAKKFARDREITVEERTEAERVMGEALAKKFGPVEIRGQRFGQEEPSSNDTDASTQ